MSYMFLKRKSVIYLAIPRFKISPTNMTGKSGEDVFLACEIVGVPKPTVLWFFESWNGHPRLISNSKQNMITTNGLHVKDVSKANEGWYMCLGNSSGGTNNATAYLRVLGKLVCTHLVSICLLLLT